MEDENKRYINLEDNEKLSVLVHNGFLLKHISYKQPNGQCMSDGNSKMVVAQFEREFGTKWIEEQLKTGGYNK